LRIADYPKNNKINGERSLVMRKRISIFILSLLLIIGFSTSGFAAKVPAPEKGGDGFKAVSLEEAKQLHKNGATMVACHSHTTDFMNGHPSGTIHITCLVPKDHKYIDMPLSEVDFDIAQLPKNKNTPIITYCASST
jgi:rhodanese-related sulfurtransferase